MHRIGKEGLGIALLGVTGLAFVHLSRTPVLGAEERISRREAITLGGLGITVLALAAQRIRPADAAGTATTVSAVSCVLTPEQTEGPYYIAKEKVRSNITERQPGTPLTLRLTVVDAASCRPIKGTAVDIWHCDAHGIYSGFESASAGGPPGGSNGPTDHDTFLRGIQFTDARGYVQFQTIYPGWYRGRTTHIHVKVHVGGAVVHTGQLYFPDPLTDTVYKNGPYAARGGAGHAEQH